jgi:tripartite-type tricarboxylate transporter receptor subunit TctC
VQALASAPGVLKPHVDAGTVRVLANWGGQRIASFPDLPTFKELGLADVEFYIWAGLFAPKGVSAPIVQKLGEAMKTAMAQPETAKAFEAAGSPPAWLDADAFRQFIDTDGARLIAAVKRIGKVE